MAAIKWKQVGGIASCYMGAVIGAGFASGQELLQFFVNFGLPGFGGILVAGALFAVLGGYLVGYKYRHRVQGYREFLADILGLRLGRLVDFWITFSLFTGLIIMVAGSAATLQEQFKLGYAWGVVFTLGVVFWATAAGEKGVLAFNGLLMPFLLIITLIVALQAIGGGCSLHSIESTPKLAMGNWLFAAILYVSYNMIIGAVMIMSLEISSKEHLLGGIVGGLGLGILAAVIAAALYCNYDEIAFLNIPMLYLAKESNPVLNYLYALVLWFAMLTTAVANAFSLAVRIAASVKISSRLVVLGLLLLSACLTPLGFAQLVAVMYPFLGYLGLVLLGGMMVALGKSGLSFCRKTSN